MKNFLLYFLNETKSTLGNVQIKNACDWGDGPQPLWIFQLWSVSTFFKPYNDNLARCLVCTKTLFLLHSICKWTVGRENKNKFFCVLLTTH